MIFAKLDVCITTHPKFVRAGPAAVGYWAASLAYSRGHELDGSLPREVLGLILGLGEREARRLADKLVEVGLFESVKETDGYRISNYDAKNETREQIEKRRLEARDRQEKWRSGKRVSHESPPPVSHTSHNGVVTGSGSDSPSGSVSEISGEPERGPPRNASDDGAGGLAVTAWAEGIASVTKQMFVAPRYGKELEKLVLGLVEFCPDYAKRVAWARQAGAEYATKQAGIRLNAHGFLDWLNSGRPDRNAKPETPPEPPGAAEHRERQRRESEQRDADRRRLKDAAAPPAQVTEAVSGILSKLGGASR